MLIKIESNWCAMTQYPTIVFMATYAVINFFYFSRLLTISLKDINVKTWSRKKFIFFTFPFMPLLSKIWLSGTFFLAIYMPIVETFHSFKNNCQSNHDWFIALQSFYLIFYSFEYVSYLLDSLDQKNNYSWSLFWFLFFFICFAELKSLLIMFCKKARNT
jgi:hypothetical protein